ncbi:DUF262 domain-containing protein [Helicobacter sp. NHP22-001]|uniref:DUF262 domain-containing protein n=1 Tax=Helicobacter sp. NHP22-001 TaxID=3040202 RepID=UPI00244D8D79|nr:DUF262 domain-containing protein [Helicobacter sp. NHP22-001]GMB96346.1 hypothetical protein NHP22001_09350 [Helicobacter sp. NHP22-001]
MLENMQDHPHIDIIDGQQRITTILIFICAMHHVLSNKAKDGALSEGATNEEFLQYLKEDFLIFRQIPRLQAVEYDRDYFHDAIIRNDDNKHAPQTPSQERIKNAKAFFIKSLDAYPLSKLLEMVDTLKKARLLYMDFGNKKDSVLMFELQNNRGEHLTHMEKLKSYLTYQIYTYSDSQGAEIRLKEMAGIFEEI